MEMSNSRLVPAPRERVFDALNDPEVLKACIPGCESFERSGESGYRATVAAKVGPVSARFVGDVTLADLDAPNGYTMTFKGQGGAAGFANGQAKVSLAPADGNQTTLAYTVSAQVGGKLAQIGSRLIDAAAAKLADDFFARFAERVAPPAADVVAAPPESPAATGANRWVRVLAIGIMVAILIYLFTRTAG